MIKDIISFSYIKNKGIRRICFLLGIAAVLCYTMMYIADRIEYTYTNNIKLIESQCRQVIEYNYPNRYVMKEHNRDKIYTLTVEYCKLVLKAAPEISRYHVDMRTGAATELAGFTLPDDAVPIWYQQPLLWCIIIFYAPFLTVLPFVWISRGFAESRGKQ